MLTTSSPKIGEIAFGRSGVGYPILDIEPDRLTLLRLDGQKIRVPSSAIIRFERPNKHYKVGDRVVLLEGIFSNGHLYQIAVVKDWGVQIRLSFGKVYKQYWRFDQIRKVAA